MELKHVLAESMHNMNPKVRICSPWYRLTRRQTITMYFLGLIGTTLLAVSFGVSFLSLPHNVQTKVLDYGKRCNDKLDCRLTFRVYTELVRPVMVYYQLQNFITTRKNYILSRNNKQLRGSNISYRQAYQCEPFRTNEEMKATNSWAGFELDPKAVASPCGMQAYYYFRDTFTLSRSNESENIPIRRTGLINNFKRTSDSQKTQWIDPTIDSFQIWMSSSISPTVEKLYGVIDQDLSPGEYSLKIKNIMYLDEEEVVIKNVQFTHQNSNYKKPHLFGWIILGGAVMLVGMAAFAMAFMKDKISWH